MSTLFQDDNITLSNSSSSRTNMSIENSRSRSDANAVSSISGTDAGPQWSVNLSWDENSTETAIRLSDYYSLPLKREGFDLNYGRCMADYGDLPQSSSSNRREPLEEPAPEDKSRLPIDRLVGPRKELNPKQHDADWGFLKEAFDFHPDSSSSTCPSLISGSTMSSRNSSTRSTRLFIRNSIERRESNAEPMPEIPAAIQKHQDAADICPVQTCKHHIKGFASSSDRVRHIITHFKGIMVCGFCPRAGMAGKKTFNSADLFLDHLVNMHRVKPKDLQPEHSGNGTAKKARNSMAHNLIATCSICSEPFDAQGFYEHLPGCVIRQIVRTAEDSVNTARDSNVDVTQRKESRNSPRNDSVVTPVEAEQMASKPLGRNRRSSALRLANTQAEELSLKLSQVTQSSQDVEIESKEIEELTASSRCLSLTSSKAADSSGEETDWTEDTHSRESTPESPQLQRRLTPMKRKLVDTIMQEFHRLLDKSLRTQAGEGGSNSAQGVYNGSSSNSSTYSSSSFISRKRSLSGGGATPPNDEDDSHKRRRSDPRGGGKQPLPEFRFACPYYKRNPGRHQTFTSCRDPGFITVARLKEHLYRRHLLPPQCNRCCTTFTNDPALREHQRDPRGCEVREQIPLEGFDKDQERKLKSKKRSLVYQSEEDKWKGVYKILFPDDNDDDMPSPYIEYQPCTGQQAEPSNVARFQEFSRLELPRLVRRTLEVVVEQEAQPLEEKLKERLIDVVQECQARLITMFQATAGPSLDSSEILQQQQQTEPIPRKPSTTSTSELELPTPAREMPQLEDFINIPFDGFDSLTVHTSATTTAHMLSSVPPPLDPSIYTPHKPCTSPVENTSGSPDSGYDSTWTSATSSRPHLPNFNPDMSFPSTTTNSFGEASNAHVDLGGYYGLFENRGLNLDPAAATVSTAPTAIAMPEHTVELETNDWSLMDPAQLTAGVGGCATGSYHNAGDVQWGYHM